MKNRIDAGIPELLLAGERLLSRIGFSHEPWVVEVASDGALVGCLAMRESGAASPSAYLAGRIDGQQSGALRCVIATDHTEISDLACTRLLGWRAVGIAELTVLTVVEPEVRLVAGNLHRHLADQFDPIHDTYELAAKNRQLVRRLEAAGIRAESRLRTGYPAHLIDAAMRETRAELLILGCTGIGLGHVATAVLHGATYPVLIVVGLEAGKGG